MSQEMAAELVARATAAERASLPKLEVELERDFAEVAKRAASIGAKLAVIHDDRLYREAGYSSFARYCSDRWGLSRAHAYRLIDLAAVAAALSPAGDIELSGRAARELMPFLRTEGPDALGGLWADILEIVGDEEVARACLLEAVRDWKQKRVAESRKVNRMAGDEPQLDGQGRPVVHGQYGHDGVVTGHVCAYCSKGYRESDPNFAEYDRAEMRCVDRRSCMLRNALRMLRPQKKSRPHKSGFAIFALCIPGLGGAEPSLHVCVITEDATQGA